MPVDGDIILKAGLDSSGISKQIGNLQKTISKGLKNAIRIGFGVRSVYALIRKLRTALFKGFEELAQVNQPFNDAMSSIMTSLNLLRNSFASAFAPIIETVAPAVTTFINLMAEAVAKIGQFIAALTGKEYVSAGSVQKDYASSVAGSTANTKKQTSATKQQTKAQKELNREITHFDDLVILHDRNDEDTSTSPATTTTPVSAFSTVPIGDAISKFAADFKAAWAKADFTDIGRMLGEKLKTALDNIPWQDIKDKLYLIAKSIATFFNGFLSTPGLFSSIGTTIAQAINSAFTFVESFISNFEWSNLGKAISDLVIGALDNLDWPLIKRTVLELGMGIGEAFRSLFGSESLRQSIFSAAANFGSSLALFLNSLLTPENFAVLGDTLYTTLETAFTVLATFGEKFNWGQFGVSLATGLNSFLQRFSPQRLAAGILTFIHGFHDTLISFLSEVHWYDFGAKLSQLIKDIPWATLLNNIGEVVWSAINAAIETFKGIFNTDNIESPFTTAIDKLQSSINRAASLIDFQTIADGVKAVVDALAPAIEGFGVGFIAVFEALVDIGTDFLVALGPALQKIADAIRTVPPDVLEAIGTALGICAGSLLAFNLVSSAVNLIATFATNLEKLVLPAKNATTALVGGGGGAVGGLAMALGKTVAGLGAFIAVWEANDKKISESQDTYINTTDIWYGLGDALSSTADEAGITYVELLGLLNPISQVASNDGKKFIETMGQVEGSLNKAGISSDSLKSALQSMIDSGAFTSDDLGVLTSYIQQMGNSADTSSQQTSDLQDVFGLFDNVSWTTGLKLALMSGAIKALGDSGSLSDEQTQELQKTLNEYDANPTEKNMAKVQKAFEKTGISSQELATAIATAGITADANTRKEFGKVAQSIMEIAKTGEENAKTGATNIGDGYTKTLESKTGESKKAGEKIVSASIDGMEEEGQMHSPSRVTQKLGGYLAQGLFIGLEQQKSKLVTLVQTIISEMMSTIERTKTQFTNLGRDLMDSLSTGITNNKGKAESASNGVIASMYNSANKLNWWNVGYNIAVGIYNGLFAHSSWLEVLAWNTAVRMYNSACRALGIHSPSRKFAYVGEMITEGMGEGIADNQDNAVNAVTDMTDAMVDEAEKNSPTVALDTSINDWIDKLDDVLTQFSDTIISKFDSMASVFAGLGNISASVPAVAQGKVVPAYATAYGASSEDVSSVKGLLENLTANQLTVEDLRPLLVEMFNEYMNLGWYVGDEQLARHVNNGNLILDRRYSKIK